MSSFERFQRDSRLRNSQSRNSSQKSSQIINSSGKKHIFNNQNNNSRQNSNNKQHQNKTNTQFNNNNNNYYPINLLIYPNELKFSFIPGNQYQSLPFILSLTNQSPDRIYFKIRTSLKTNNNYIISPYEEVIQKGNSMNIKFILINKNNQSLSNFQNDRLQVQWGMIPQKPNQRIQLNNNFVLKVRVNKQISDSQFGKSNNSSSNNINTNNNNNNNRFTLGKQAQKYYQKGSQQHKFRQKKSNTFKQNENVQKDLFKGFRSDHNLEQQAPVVYQNDFFYDTKGNSKSNPQLNLFVNSNENKDEDQNNNNKKQNPYLKTNYMKAKGQLTQKQEQQMYNQWINYNKNTIKQQQKKLQLELVEMAFKHATQNIDQNGIKNSSNNNFSNGNWRASMRNSNGQIRVSRQINKSSSMVGQGNQNNNNSNNNNNINSKTNLRNQKYESLLTKTNMIIVATVSFIIGFLVA